MLDNTKFLNGFVKKCCELGMDEDQTVECVRLAATVGNPDFMQGFDRAITKYANDSMSPAIRAGLLGAGIGGAGGFLLGGGRRADGTRRSRLRSALMGSLVGGAGLGGLSYIMNRVANSRPMHGPHPADEEWKYSTPGYGNRYPQNTGVVDLGPGHHSVFSPEYTDAEIRRQIAEHQAQ